MEDIVTSMGVVISLQLKILAHTADINDEETTALMSDYIRRKKSSYGFVLLI